MNTLEKFITDNRLNECEVMNTLQEEGIISDNCTRAHEVMEQFIQVFFWVGLVGCILRLFLIGVRQYPAEVKETLGGDIVKFIEQAFFVTWAGVLLWSAR